MRGKAEPSFPSWHARWDPVPSWMGGQVKRWHCPNPWSCTSFRSWAAAITKEFAVSLLPFTDHDFGSTLDERLFQDLGYTWLYPFLLKRWLLPRLYHRLELLKVESKIIASHSLTMASLSDTRVVGRNLFLFPTDVGWGLASTEVPEYQVCYDLINMVS